MTDRTRTACVMMLVMIAALVVSITVLSIVPPVSKDALVHHLAVPKRYLERGALHEIPHLEFSYFPMNVDLLYLIPLALGNDTVPKFIHFGFALLTAWLIFGYLRRRVPRSYALFGVLLFLSTPIIVNLSITAYVDLGLVFFSTASLLGLLRWRELRFPLWRLAVAAMWCGLAMGTKYNGLITFFILSCAVPVLYARTLPGEPRVSVKAAGLGVVFAVTALLVFSPWAVRNAIWTGNPLYPLYESLFNPAHGGSSSSVSVLGYRAAVYGESWWEIALVPVRIFFQGRDGDPRYFDGVLNPFLLVCAVAAFSSHEGARSVLRMEKRVLLAFAVLCFTFAFFGRLMRVRYLVTMIPCLVILSVFGVRIVVDRVTALSSRGTRRVGLALVFGALCLCLGLNAAYVVRLFRVVDPLSFIGGTVSRDEYIERFRPEHRALRFINEHVPESGRVLFIFLGGRGYYCDREHLFDMSNGKSILERIVKESADPDEAFSRVRAMGISHMLIRWETFTRMDRGRVRPP